MSAPSVPMALSLRNLTKSFSGSDRGFTLQVPELDIPEGSVNVVIGRSGCGKSTLLDILGLISTPDTVERFTLPGADGAPVQLQKDTPRQLKEGLRRSALGYVLQTGGLLPFLDVWDNISLPLRLSGAKKDTARVQQLMQRLEIDPLRRAFPAQLSTGQRQRVAIARALVHRPHLVLADEPTGSLDPESARIVKKLLLENARENHVATLIVTHDAELFRNGADRVFGFELAASANHLTSTLICKG